MPHLLIIAQDSKPLSDICSGLLQDGFDYSCVPYDADLAGIVSSQSTALILVEMKGRLPNSETWQIIKGIKRVSHLPVIALIDRQILESTDRYIDADDFIVNPFDVGELIVRVKRFLQRIRDVDSSELIKCDGLVIDLANCEVTVNGRIVELTFKEYALLKFLAANRGRVYSRDALLNEVWGYNYFGGDRTVDVHIRRLRGKIEGSTDVFIETVRNIGYRFKKDA